MFSTNSLQFEHIYRSQRPLALCTHSKVLFSSHILVLTLHNVRSRTQSYTSGDLDAHTSRIKHMIELVLVLILYIEIYIVFGAMRNYCEIKSTASTKHYIFLLLEHLVCESCNRHLETTKNIVTTNELRITSTIHQTIEHTMNITNHMKQQAWWWADSDSGCMLR